MRGSRVASVRVTRRSQHRSRVAWRSHGRRVHRRVHHICHSLMTATAQSLLNILAGGCKAFCVDRSPPVPTHLAHHLAAARFAANVATALKPGRAASPLATRFGTLCAAGRTGPQHRCRPRPCTSRWSCRSKAEARAIRSLGSSCANCLKSLRRSCRSCGCGTGSSPHTWRIIRQGDGCEQIDVLHCTPSASTMLSRCGRASCGFLRQSSMTSTSSLHAISSPRWSCPARCKRVAWRCS